MKEYLEILRERNCLLLVLGQLVSNLGSSIHSIATIWLITQTTGSAKSVSLFFILLSIPTIVIGPVAGVWVERWSKKRVIVGTDFMRGILAICMACVPGLTTIYVASFLSAVAALFFAPAIRTAIPKLVKGEQLTTANALSALTGQATRLVGPALGGILIGLHGARIAFLLNGISFILSAISECYIQMDEDELVRQPATRRTFTGDLAEAWTYIKDNRAVRFVIAFFALTGLPLGAIMVLQVVFLKEILGFGAEQYGFIMTLQGLGLVSGTLLMGKFGRRLHELPVIVVTVAGINASFLLLAASSLYWQVALVFLFIGFLAASTNIAYATYLQKAVASSVRSRVFALDMAIGEIFGLLSAGMAGFLGDALGVGRVIGVCGAFGVAASVLVMFLPVYLESRGELKATDLSTG